MPNAIKINDRFQLAWPPAGQSPLSQGGTIGKGEVGAGLISTVLVLRRKVSRSCWLQESSSRHTGMNGVGGVGAFMKVWYLYEASVLSLQN